MNFDNTDNYIYNGEVKEFKYRTTATLSEQITFVEMVSDGVFVGDSYLPLLKEPVFDYWLIATFTDIDMGELADIDVFDRFNKETGVAERIRNKLNSILLNNLSTSVDSNIEYKKSIAHDNISTAIVDLINMIKDKIEAFGNGLNSDVVMDFIQKFSESGIDGESIVKAYLDSDQYKENVADVVDAKNADIRDLKQQLNKVTAQNVLADKSNKVFSIKSE